MIKVLVFPFAALDARVSRQLPTYNGTKSYQNLLVEVYGIDMGSGKKDYYLQIKPTNLIRGGLYNYGSGGITNDKYSGFYWESRSYTIIYAWSLYFSYGGLNSQNGNNKGMGFSLRCLVPLAGGNSLPTMVLKAIRTYWLECMEVQTNIIYTRTWLQSHYGRQLILSIVEYITIVTEISMIE